MTIALALQDLRDSTARLSEAVTELVTIAHEDRPRGSEVAAVDHFAEQVSELQSYVMTASRELAGIEGPAGLAEGMPAVDAALADAAHCYWRNLRSYSATTAMRQAARRGGTDWRSWQLSIEQSQERCEQPLLDVTAAARHVWAEVAELVALWLGHSPHPTDPSLTTEADAPAPENTWRTT